MSGLRYLLKVLLLLSLVGCAGRQPPGAPVADLGADAAWGRPQAPVTIVELCDFQCPFCARVQTTLRQIQAIYGPDRVRILFKHNPLPVRRAPRAARQARRS